MTSGSQEVRVERDGRAMTITLDRPDDQNRLTRDVLLTLQGLVDGLGVDEGTHAVVITGSGAAFFSMGILNPVVRGSYTKDQILELVRMANRLYDAIEALPQIVIAAFNGAARAGAAELSLACDIRLAAAHATFALPEALWGGFPGAGGPVRLPGIVGRARALEFFLQRRTANRWNGWVSCSRSIPRRDCFRRRARWPPESAPAGRSPRGEPSAS